MRISLCIAIIAIGTTFANARPLSEDAVVASDQKMEWTDLMPSSSNVNEANTGSSNYKEFEHAADQEIHKQEEEEEGQVNYSKPNINIDVNQEATKYTKGSNVDKKTALDQGQLGLPPTTANKASDMNSIASSTKYVFDIIMKPGESEAQASQSDTTLMDVGTRNGFSKNELASDTTDYANREAIERGNSMRVASNQDNQVPLPPIIQVGDEDKEQEQEESASFDFLDALDQALLDPYISAIDSNLNSEVYEAPVTETTTFEVATNGDIPGYVSLIAEQIRSAEEQIRIKHDELIQDQQQIDDLKRKIHHSSATITTTTAPLADPTFSVEVIESGPDETMYVYKHVQPTASAVNLQPPPPPPPQTQPGLGTSVTHPLPPPSPTKRPDLETDHQQELRAEQNVPGAVINNTPFYNLVQKQTDEDDYYQTKIKKGSASSSVEAVDLVIPPRMGDTAFDPSNKLKLPNGSWTPSCKNVSKGLYCLQPNGQGSTIIECSGENVGFQFSCGKNMLCYSTGPFDVDCQKAQGFINDE